MNDNDASQQTLAQAKDLEIYGAVYEHSAWVAEIVLREGLPLKSETADAIAERMAAVVEASGRTRQLELLRLHPELASRTGIASDLTESSRSEQTSASLDQCTPEEFARFQQLNDNYRVRFGFPFIVAVTGLTRSDILEAFETRIRNTEEIEFRTALDEVHKIARIRINKIKASQE
ncbi:2-oxo-4-hydroxy-4-carboxy-5-ureidoimidazoline decarboxylase [Hyphomicrobium sp. CS1GBMeth3]|uniref:2-oxo-4-hydroxy-4-carboxy-5-ureidoimidazoline decarboxylase n=1 Tax=Hyphomicrobium sp. CS1GBMeth3 TaxID=1892845 RepID=UPI000931E74A|nr:2-oxo-4-hydroxy-4-carboxy-5-ureidoimidazoline decarboxylase [Hyphomicrobium sp. CS1GBMeth3]